MDVDNVPAGPSEEQQQHQPPLPPPPPSSSSSSSSSSSPSSSSSSSWDVRLVVAAGAPAPAPDEGGEAAAAASAASAAAASAAATSTSTSTSTAKLALPRLVGVELPVLCTRPQTALARLGGGERVVAACKGEARKLHFHFRPQDELSVPLTSQPRQTASRLLLRVRVRRRKGPSGERRVAGAEVVGTVPTAFRFVGLADFQYLTLQSFVPAGLEGEAVSKTRVRLACVRACVRALW
jgi:hypothetical protein